MNAVSLPDELVFALNRFLGLNVGESTASAQPCETTSPPPCEEEPRPRPRLYPISDDDSVDDPCSRSFLSYPMRRNCQEDAHYRSTRNGPTSRQNAPPKGRLSPSCSKNKDYHDYNSPECTNSPLFHQEEPSVYLCQGQGLLQQIIPQNRFYQQQSHLNRSQQSPHSSPRSQSLPRGNASDRYNHSDRCDGHRGLHTEQESLSPQRGRCELRTPCEGESPAENSGPSNCQDRYISERSSRNNAPCGWNNSSQVGTNYGEWQRRQLQMQMQHQQQQHQQQQHQQQQHQQQQHEQQQCQARQQQANQSNLNWLEDDEISGFEPDLHSTMIDEDKRCQPLTKTCQQQATQRQCPSGNKTCHSQSQSQRMCRTAEEMLRRQSQCQSPQMPRRQPQCESPPMQRRKPQQYETLINETSYMQLPEAPRNAQCRPSINQNQCPNAMYQDISPMNQTKPCQQNPRSLSPINCSTFRDQPGNQTACETDSPKEMDMDLCTPDFYPEDTNCSRSPEYMEMSRAILGRSCHNDTSTFGGRTTRMHAKTPEELLADRTQAEFMDALVKDRSCPGAIQASLNGTDNFNEFAFDIAFSGSIPSKPFPVDPITMLEAIKLRIDYERGEIRKRVRDHERDPAKDKHFRTISTEDIESYFGDYDQSEVNEGVAAFLKAESEYRQTDVQRDNGFVAQINSLDTNMFDEKIKLNVYSATTRPAHH